MVDPNWITGFTDGEGCFSLFVHKDRHKRKGGREVIYYRWTAIFIIGLRGDDINVLEKFKEFFNCGYVSTTHTKETAHLHDYGKAYYQTRSIKELTDAVIPHFDKYPLQSKKLNDYILWKEAVEIMASSRIGSGIFDKIVYTDKQKERLSEIHLLMRKRLSGTRKDWVYKNIDLDGTNERLPALGQTSLFSPSHSA